MLSVVQTGKVKPNATPNTLTVYFNYLVPFKNFKRDLINIIKPQHIVQWCSGEYMQIYRA